MPWLLAINSWKLFSSMIYELNALKFEFYKYPFTNNFGVIRIQNFHFDVHESLNYWVSFKSDTNSSRVRWQNLSSVSLHSWQWKSQRIRSPPQQLHSFTNLFIFHVGDFLSFLKTSVSHNFSSFLAKDMQYGFFRVGVAKHWRRRLYRSPRMSFNETYQINW